MKFRISSMLVATGLAMASLGAQAAAEWTWTLNAAPVDNPAVLGVDLPGSASVMGYSAPNNSTNLVATSGATLPDMTWYDGGGYGICSPTPGDPTCSSPNHALDNNVAYESILLSFGKLVTLTSMSIGWYSTNSDMSVLAYTGSGTPTLTSSKYENLLSNGWSLVGQYSNVGSTAQLNTSTSSSYWLIAAYNSTFQNKGWTENNDYVKVLSVAGNTNPPPGKVSEPAALMLMATGLLGTWGLRRRRPSV